MHREFVSPFFSIIPKKKIWSWTWTALHALHISASVMINIRVLVHVCVISDYCCFTCAVDCIKSAFYSIFVLCIPSYFWQLHPNESLVDEWTWMLRLTVCRACVVKWKMYISLRSVLFIYIPPSISQFIQTSFCCIFGTWNFLVGGSDATDMQCSITLKCIFCSGDPTITHSLFGMYAGWYCGTPTLTSLGHLRILSLPK